MNYTLPERPCNRLCAPCAAIHGGMLRPMDEARNPYLVRAADLTGAFTFHHPLNPASEVVFLHQGGKTLSELTGLTRTGVHLCRIPPGKEAFAYHLHHREEEWVYVLSGQGIAEIGEQSLPVGPGDFLGYPPGTVGHHLRNPSSSEDLVCLMGGERGNVEVADFPRLGKRMVRTGDEALVVDRAAMQDLFKTDG